MAPTPAEPQRPIPGLEQRVLRRWRARDVSGESSRRREGAPSWVLWERPPTPDRPPAVGDVLNRAFMDVFARYRAMRGYDVERRRGYSSHGSSVEIAVERQLEIACKEQVERYGVAAFNARCRALAGAQAERWDALTDRIGCLQAGGDASSAHDASYVESVWWALKEIADQGLLYESDTVVPYCPRCATALSSVEVAHGGPAVEVSSIYVRLSVAKDGGPLQRGDELLTWTSAPWTLVANAAVAVDPDVTYVRAKTSALDAPVVVAEALVERVLGRPAGLRILERFPGAAIDGVRYEPPFRYLPEAALGERGHTVQLADVAGTRDGTGLVAATVALGDDARRGACVKVVNPVRGDGTFDERVGRYAGRFVTEAGPDLVEDLRARGRLLREESRERCAPRCGHCSTPLLYVAKSCWLVATTAPASNRAAANGQPRARPEHAPGPARRPRSRSDGGRRVSRDRYWGTPLPIWRCESGHVTVVGSFDDLEQRSGVRLSDPHRPYVDDIVIACDACGEPATRVADVVDEWLDVSAMAFAQRHEPFEGVHTIDELYPADAVCEELDRTHRWLSSLQSVSTLLRGDESLCEHVVRLGPVVGAQAGLLDRHGADALRWHVVASRRPSDACRLEPDAIDAGARSFLRRLWSTFAFATRYGPGPERAATECNDLDRWARSRLSATVATVTEQLDAYCAAAAARAVDAFVDDLSNWYVRRSRRRLRDGDGAAHETLRHCLVTVAQLIAPVTPFIADEIYEALDGSEPSVHLTDWPRPAARDPDVEAAMAAARRTVRLGLAARAAAKLKVRQPLREAVVAAGPERAAIERLADIVCDELNVKALRFVDDARDLGASTRGASQAVTLELPPDEGLQREGLAREVIHAVQRARRDAGLGAGDRVVVTLGGDVELLDAARAHAARIAREVLAESVVFDGDRVGLPTGIEGRELRVALRRAEKVTSGETRRSDIGEQPGGEILP